MGFSQSKQAAPSRKRARSSEDDDAPTEEKPRKQARTHTSDDTLDKNAEQDCDSAVTESEDQHQGEDEESSELEESSVVSSSTSSESGESLFPYYQRDMRDDPGGEDMLYATDSDEEDEEEDYEDDGTGLSTDPKHLLGSVPIGLPTLDNDETSGSKLRGRLKGFLAQMRASSMLQQPAQESQVEIIPQDDEDEEEESEIKIRDEVQDSDGSEDGDGQTYVEMNVGLGVLEEQDPKNNSADDESESDDGEKDVMHKLLQRKPQKRGVQEL